MNQAIVTTWGAFLTVGGAAPAPPFCCILIIFSMYSWLMVEWSMRLRTPARRLMQSFSCLSEKRSRKVTKTPNCALPSAGILNSAATPSGQPVNLVPCDGGKYS